MNGDFLTMKLSSKLLLAPMIIIALLAILTCVTYVSLSHQKRSTTEMYQQRFKQYEEIARVLNQVNQVHASVYKVLSWSGANFDRMRVDALGKEQLAVIDRNRAALQKMAEASSEDTTSSHNLLEIIKNITDYRKNVSETIEFAVTDIGLANTYMGTAETSFQVLLKNLHAHLEREAALSTRHFALLQDNFDRMLVILGFAILLAGLIAVFVSSRINRTILDSLGGEPAYVAEIARKVAGGNLALQIETDENHPESLLAVVKDMVSSLNRIVGKVDRSAADLSRISDSLTEAATRVAGATNLQASGITKTSTAVSEISASLSQVARWVDNLSNSAAESSSSILEMSASNNEVAHNMETLSQSVDEVSSSIIQMSSTIHQLSDGVSILMDASSTTASSIIEMDKAIKQVEKHASFTAGITDAVRQDAEIGNQTVEATITGIGEIRRSARITSDVIASLSRRVLDIGAILAVIDDVAKQTSLLALNAAIIAAQAGERGKGFAVVAGEIKQLAESTTRSTKEIARVITGVQDETLRAVEAMNEAEKSISDGEELSSKAGASLKKIVSEAQQASGQMAEIARATMEQSRGSQSISDAMAQVSELVGQFAKASREQAQGSELITMAVDRMKDLSQQVLNSSREQNNVGTVIAHSTSDITGMIRKIKLASDEQSRGSDQIVMAVENIQQSSQVNLDTAAVLNEAATSLARQVHVLRKEMQTFQV
jgi:methyl-accepting chemotaxis protein